MKLTSSTHEMTLPNYARDGFKELIIPNHAKNTSLSGKLYVDFYNKRNGWKITFDAITADEYADLRALYDDQFTNEEFLTFDRTGLSADIVQVFLNMPAERNIVWDQQAVLGLTITLEPENAVS